DGESRLTPLPLPENFNPETYLIAKTTENGIFHESRQGASFAARLVANGAPEDLELAHKVLDVVLRAQERHPDDPHYGNFMWMIEDTVVQDLNAVEFNLEHLIPMMLQHADCLSPEMRDRVLDAIRLGLDEIRRLDVLPVYTNITLLDILNTCLGGELLDDADIAQRGYSKLALWMALTDQQGHPFEYNSPTYSAVTIRALARLASLTCHADTRIRARTALARLGLSAVLHIHAATGRWTGPHSRAYHPSVVCETEAEVAMLRRWIADGTLPAWIADALDARPAAFQVDETAFAERQLGLTTFHSPSFALGVSVKEAGGQSNVMMCHYDRPGANRPGVLYTRYLTNDKWLGDFYHATDRTKSRNLVEEGQFYGVQQGNRAIGLYTVGRLGTIHSAKAAFIWTQRTLVDEIWVGDQRIESLPVDVPSGKVVVVGSGNALFAVLPLTHTDMGRDAPIRLVERAGDLVLEIYNYLGPEKGFWEMGWPGAFYKGKPQCGVYLEVAERAAYSDGRAFGQTVASGALLDETGAPFTYTAEGERLWTVEYGRDGQTLGIEVDLMAWALKRRWTQDGDLGWPMLESPVARQSRTGHIEVGGATLDCATESAWLFASPATGHYVAAYHGLMPAPLTLTTPGGTVEIPVMGTGVVVWDNGEVAVDALDVGVPS
ncbi:MAG: hypothetical protein JXR84_16940, partial [Anaerolineae bacterium]|nr:hypothetical protein [Anaerolineae bacterium]